MTRRGDDIPRPRPWEVKAADRQAGKGWDDLVAQFPEAADRAWVAMTSDPKTHGDRQHRLKGSLGTTSVAGKSMEQWEYEALKAGRVRYAIDDDARIIWVTQAGVGHPKDTDKRRRKKR